MGDRKPSVQNESVELTHPATHQRALDMELLGVNHLAGMAIVRGVCGGTNTCRIMRIFEIGMNIQLC